MLKGGRFKIGPHGSLPLDSVGAILGGSPESQQVRRVFTIPAQAFIVAIETNSVGTPNAHELAIAIGQHLTGFAL